MLYTSFERCLNGILIQHDVGVSGVVVQVCAKLYLRAVFKGITDKFIFTYPITELNNGRLIACKIDKAVSGKHGEYIEVVGELPVCFVGRGVGGEIRWVDKEYHTGHVFILLEQLTIVARGNDESVEIVIGWRVVGSFHPVI